MAKKMAYKYRQQRPSAFGNLSSSERMDRYIESTTTGRVRKAKDDIEERRVVRR